MSAGATTALEVAGLRVDHTASGRPIVDDVSFAVEAGTVLALVGESGSGKTTVAMALLGYARPGARVADGKVVIGGTDIVSLSDAARRRVRGTMTSYVGQDPANSMDPSMRIGKQMRELLATHDIEGPHAEQRIAEYLGRVALPADSVFLRRYPHQLSGGQIQRVLLAMALAVEPSLVVLDEPTTSLDVKVQQEVLSIIRHLKHSANAALVYVSHDLAVVSEIADHVAVMYGGRIVEQAPARQLFADPQHPYTARLLGSVPRITPERRSLQQIAGTAVGVLDRPAGCPFQPRCTVALDACAEMPAFHVVATNHVVRCFNAGADRPTTTIVAADADLRTAGTDSDLLAIRSLSARTRRATRSSTTSACGSPTTSASASSASRGVGRRRWRDASWVCMRNEAAKSCSTVSRSRRRRASVPATSSATSRSCSRTRRPRSTPRRPCSGACST